MGITERREREKEEVRKKILDAARELFMTEGYEQVTMRRIAEAIEYSPTAIYLHFEDKDDLVLALCREDFGRLLDAIEEPGASRRPGRVDPPARPGLRARSRLDNPNHYRFMFMTPLRAGAHARADGSRPPVVRRPSRGGRPGHRERSLPAGRRGHHRRR